MDRGEEMEGLTLYLLPAFAWAVRGMETVKDGWLYKVVLASCAHVSVLTQRESICIGRTGLSDSNSWLWVIDHALQGHYAIKFFRMSTVIFFKANAHKNNLFIPKWQILLSQEHGLTVLQNTVGNGRNILIYSVDLKTFQFLSMGKLCSIYPISPSTFFLHNKTAAQIKAYLH